MAKLSFNLPLMKILVYLITLSWPYLSQKMLSYLQEGSVRVEVVGWYKSSKTLINYIDEICYL